MKAALYREYGAPNVVNIEEMPLPDVEKNEVRVRVHATTVSSADSRIRAMRIPTGFKTMSRLIFGITRPKNQVLGSEFSGTVDAIGPDVTQFNVGDAVFGAYEGRGTHAEYFSMAEDEAIEHLPAGFTHVEAAALPFGGLTSLIFLRDLGHIKAGQKVLVIGASGSLGSAGVQLAVHLGPRLLVCAVQRILSSCNH